MRCSIALHILNFHPSSVNPSACLFWLSRIYKLEVVVSDLGLHRHAATHVLLAQGLASPLSPLYFTHSPLHTEIKRRKVLQRSHRSHSFLRFLYENDLSTRNTHISSESPILQQHTPGFMRYEYNYLWFQKV